MIRFDYFFDNEKVNTAGLWQYQAKDHNLEALNAQIHALQNE